MSVVLDEEKDENATKNAAESTLLSFSLGPVQPFIAAARSVRDLWTGSYLLSWLSFKGLSVIIDEITAGQLDKDAIIFPALGADDAFWKYHTSEGQLVDKAILDPCLPNRFLVELNSVQMAEKLADRCKERVEKEWRTIAAAVLKSLQRELKQSTTGTEIDQIGLRLWAQQIDDFFEVRTSILPTDGLSDDELNSLLDPTVRSLERWPKLWKLAQGVLTARRSVRHTPQYEPREKDSLERVPAKCSVLGTYEQIGPAEANPANAYWKRFSDATIMHGARVRQRERLCAVSLMKRFAWPAYFDHPNHLNLGEVLSEDSAKRTLPEPIAFDDTATVAAAKWFGTEIGDESGPYSVAKRAKNTWSGQWLHWLSQKPKGSEASDDPPPTDGQWNLIHRLKEQNGSPPTYYAIIASDGDKAGQLSEFASQEEQRTISRLLATCARASRDIVKKHFGVLIYSGGDDVLAMCPTETAIKCALDLRTEFEAIEWPEKAEEMFLAKQNGKRDAADQLKKPSISAGIAVLHYKDDLRYGMAQARAAEALAKDSGRNAAALAVCRRSGSHDTTLVSWDLLQNRIDDWVETKFGKEKLSDRWAYHLATEGHELYHLNDIDAIRSEILRQVKRGVKEHGKSFQPKDVGDVFEAYIKFRQQSHRLPDDAGFYQRHTDKDAEAALKKRQDALQHRFVRDFVTLCQSASFLARGKDA